MTAVVAPGLASGRSRDRCVWSRLVELHPFIAEGRPGGRALVTLKAAWGAEHVTYTATLLHLLKRLKAVGGVFVDASVESRATRTRPKAARRLKVRDRELPIVLRHERDLS